VASVFQANLNVHNADYKPLKNIILTDDSPMTGMTWHEAAWYCNWLSGQEGLPESQWCYEQNKDGVYGPGMKAKEKFWELTGYRLPTESEWEFSCRAGAETSRFYGSAESLLPYYAWHLSNGDNHTHPVASLKPNDLGLFDMQGNSLEWCFDEYMSYPMPSGLLSVFQRNTIPADSPHTRSVAASGRRVLRGGSFLSQMTIVRSAYRLPSPSAIGSPYSSFRPARTYEPTPEQRYPCPPRKTR